MPSSWRDIGELFRIGEAAVHHHRPQPLNSKGRWPALLRLAVVDAAAGGLLLLMPKSLPLASRFA
jgi:hypothetical protein